MHTGLGGGPVSKNCEMFWAKGTQCQMIWGIQVFCSEKATHWLNLNVYCVNSGVDIIPIRRFQEELTFSFLSFRFYLIKQWIGCQIIQVTEYVRFQNKYLWHYFSFIRCENCQDINFVFNATWVHLHPNINTHQFMQCVFLGDKKATTLDTALTPPPSLKVPICLCPSSLLLHVQLLLCFYLTFLYLKQKGIGCKDLGTRSLMCTA